MLNKHKNKSYVHLLEISLFLIQRTLKLVDEEPERQSNFTRVKPINCLTKGILHTLVKKLQLVMIEKEKVIPNCLEIRVPIPSEYLIYQHQGATQHSNLNDEVYII